MSYYEAWKLALQQRDDARNAVNRLAVDAANLELERDTLRRAIERVLDRGEQTGTLPEASEHELRRALGV